MTVVDNPWTRVLYDRSTAAGEAVLRAVFGDRLGITLFLGTLVFVATYWRIGFFISDNIATANTLVNSAEWHLQITHVVYGPDSGVTPGMKVHEGRLYGLNYGLVFAALPFLWAFRALNAITDFRIALAALWSLIGLACCLQIGHLLDRYRTAALGGSFTALGLFVLNIATATPLDPRWVAMIALQTSTMVWAGLIAVFLYRLTNHIYDRRTGVFAGAIVVAATPIGFWASIPKRHVLIALLALLTIYCFYRSRPPHAHLGFRALAYVFVGLGAWVFPLEPLLLLVVLVPIDLLTARSNGPRQLAVVACAFLVSLLPFFLTNALITGNPLKPPRLLSSYNGAEQLLTGGTNGGTTGGTGGGGGGSGSGGGPGGGRGSSTPGLGVSIVAFVLSSTDAAGAQLDRLWSGFITPGVTTLVSQPDRVYHTFIRSGYIQRVATGDGGQAINLALLESMPLLAVLAGFPAVAARKIRNRSAVRTWLDSPAGQTDLLVVAYALLVTLAYLPRLPIHAMITVRYLLPIIPGLVYLIVRLPPVRRVVQTNGRVILFTYVGGVLIGGQLLLLALLLTSPSLGEAVQLHALFGLGIAIPLGVWTLVATGTDRQFTLIGAVLLGLAAAVITVFLVLSGLVYFAYAGDFALPLSQRVSELLGIL